MAKNIPRIFDIGQNKSSGLWGFVRFILSGESSAIRQRWTRKLLLRFGLVREPRQKKYPEWLRQTNDPSMLRQEFDQAYAAMQTGETVSVVMIARRSEEHLKAAVHSIQNQFYPHWQLLLVTDLQPDEYANADQRITYINNPDRGSAADRYNAAIERATGRYILVLDTYCLLEPHCLFEVIRTFMAPDKPGLIYWDSDETDGTGNYSNPYFKPGWSPDTLLSRNYVGNAFAFDRSLLSKEAVSREGFSGAELFDLLLRLTERSPAIKRIPKILSHTLDTATSPQASGAEKAAVMSALVRRGTPANIEDMNTPGIRHVRYSGGGTARVSIIIPTRDKADLLSTAIASITGKTTYPDYEILVVDNNSTTTEFHDLAQELTSKYRNIRVITANIAFNFSALINAGVAASTGEYILLLNNDIEVIGGDWLTRMIAHARQPHIAAVGAKLLYPGDTIQHAGIVAGIHGEVGHVFRGMPADADGYHHCVSAATNYLAVTGACLMCTRTAFLAVGGMDTAFAVEFNDIDLCIRLAEHIKGYVVYLPDVVLYHHESVSRGHPMRNKKSWEQHSRELALFRNRWGWYLDNDPYYNPNLSLDATDFRIK